jgi:phosphopantothenoylcysteine decarboxylase/phosphopantothenate--cysteine ligase
MRFGIADNLLTATLLATRAPIAVAPAMNDGMWESPITQENIAALRERGVTVIDPDSGELACGTTGKGRMMESAAIFEALRFSPRPVLRP